MRVNVYSVTYVLEYADRSVSDPQHIKVAAADPQQAQEAAWHNARLVDPSVVTVRSIGGPAMVCSDVLVSYDGEAEEESILLPPSYPQVLSELTGAAPVVVAVVSEVHEVHPPAESSPHDGA